MTRESAPPEIRPTDLTRPADAAALLDLLDHYARDPMGGGKGLAEEARARLVAQLAARGDFLGFIAWQDGEPVGLVNVFEGFSTFAAKPLLNIHDIVVRADRRGQGIARALLAAVEAAARARGCCKLTLEVLSNNRTAMRTYAASGFAPYELDPAAGQALFLERKL